MLRFTKEQQEILLNNRRAFKARQSAMANAFGTTMLGNLVITLDPVFNGLALAIIFGIVASTLFSLVVVPVVYLMVFDDGAAAPAVESSEESVL